MKGLFSVRLGALARNGSVYGYAPACGGMLWAPSAFLRDVEAKAHLLKCAECVSATPVGTDGWHLLDELTAPAVSHV